MTVRELIDFGYTIHHGTPVIFRDKGGNYHQIYSAVKPQRGGPLVLLEDCPKHYELSIDPHPKELIEWWENVSDEELKELGLLER